MKKITQNLYITYSHQRAKELKQNGKIEAFDKVTTLSTFMFELFEAHNYALVIDEVVASSILYKIVQEHNISYFSYLEEGALSFLTLYDFFLKCKENEIAFNALHSGDKLTALESLYGLYQEYKQQHNLADRADVVCTVVQEIETYFQKNKYEKIFVDNFHIGNIYYITSKKQEEFLEIIKKHSQSISSIVNMEESSTKLIKPKHQVFDTVDEIKTALKIVRKLLETDVKSSEVLIVTTTIQEHTPLFKLFLEEYQLQGYSSLGTSLIAFEQSDEPKVKDALKSYSMVLENLKDLYKKLGLSFHSFIAENIKKSIKIAEEKVGIKLIEANQLVGLQKSYKHIIFIGTDINHFPPQPSDNFLYSYDDALEYFYETDYFKSSQTQYDELKRLSEHLYIITASNNDKRELSSSIIIDSEFDDIIDVSDVKSLCDLALTGATTQEESQKIFYESISDHDFTRYDGKDVVGMDARHLSASQINKYLACPLAYLYSSKLKIKSPKQETDGFDVMQQGSLMHLCYELFGRELKDRNRQTQEYQKLYDLMFTVSNDAYNAQATLQTRGEENIHHKLFLLELQAGLKDGRKKGLLAKFVDYYIQKAQQFNYFKNSEFEMEFSLDENLQPIKNKADYFIKGFIDRFDNLDDHLNIVDYKSKKVQSLDKQKQQEVEELKDIQLALYILYAKQLYPNKTIDAHLLSFKGNEKGVKFASLSEIDDKKLKSIINNTKLNIEKGEFSFDNSDEKTCKWCDIKYICHESVLKNKVINVNI